MRARQLWRKTRREIQPPRIHVINYKLYGRSRWFWRGLRDHDWAYRTQGPMKEYQWEAEEVRTPIFHNHEDIIVLVRDRKTPMTVLNTSIHSALSTQDQKDPIIVMIQTKKIEQYVKNRSRLRQNIIRLYGLIWYSAYQN